MDRIGSFPTREPFGAYATKEISGSQIVWPRTVEGEYA